jgi:hypothetical protein
VGALTQPGGDASATAQPIEGAEGGKSDEPSGMQDPPAGASVVDGNRHVPDRRHEPPR